MHVHEYPANTEREIRLAFHISVWLKAINAVLEIILGIVLATVGGLTRFVQHLADNELIQDPSDVIAGWVRSFINHLPLSTQLFAGVYLLSHGVIKVFLCYGLLKNKLWAYPVSIGVFILFIIYQVYRFTHTHSIFLVLLTIFDIFLVWMVWHEYGMLTAKKVEVNKM